MNAVWLRIVYIIEFLLAIPAVYTLWSQIGGQGHLDIMPWYSKLLLGGGACWTLVRATGAAIEHERVWNVRTLAWIGAMILVAVLIGLTTYYYHLHEAPDQADPEETTTALLQAVPIHLPA